MFDPEAAHHVDQVVDFRLHPQELPIDHRQDIPISPDDIERMIIAVAETDGKPVANAQEILLQKRENPDNPRHELRGVFADLANEGIDVVPDGESVLQ